MIVEDRGRLVAVFVRPDLAIVGIDQYPGRTGMPRAIRSCMANKAGYAFAWLLGIPLPILLIVYLVSRC
jgi:hypothetical protein